MVDALFTLETPASDRGQALDTAPPLRTAPWRPRSAGPQWEWVPEGWRDGDPRRAGGRRPSVIATQPRLWPVHLALIRGKRPLEFHLFAHGPIKESDQSAHRPS